MDTIDVENPAVWESGRAKYSRAQKPFITTCLREVMLAGVHHKRPDALTRQPRLRAAWCVMVDKGLLSVWITFESNLPQIVCHGFQTLYRWADDQRGTSLS